MTQQDVDKHRAIAQILAKDPDRLGAMGTAKAYGLVDKNGALLPYDQVEQDKRGLYHSVRQQLEESQKLYDRGRVLIDTGKRDQKQPQGVNPAELEAMLDYYENEMWEK